MAPRDRPLIDIVYKYNARRVISFIVTDKSRSSKTDIPYYLSILINLLILTFAQLLVPLFCQKQYLLLMRSTPITNQGNII